MESKGDYIELVVKAQNGDEQSMNRLAERASERLTTYVYRIVLEDNVAQDIVQESMLEMFKILGKLKKTDQFWSWLYGIALKKVHRYQRTAYLHREVSGTETAYEKAAQNEQEKKQEGLEKLVGEELRQLVRTTMQALKPSHRAVLCMRCYDNMTFAEIAESVGCSEFAARMLFYRAKRALQKHLSRHGLGKGSALTALVLFGKMTASSEAAAAEASITAASTKVGLGVQLLGIATGRTTVVALATAGVLTVGTIVATSGPDKLKGALPESRPTSSRVPGRTGAAGQEYWCYFPESGDGPVMMRMMKLNSDGKQPYCVWRQNEGANYHFDKRKNTMHIENHRMWQSDLSVWRLPTDQPELSEFLARVEGRTGPFEYVPTPSKGLLVITRQSDNEGNGKPRIVRHRNILEEEYFLYELPRGVKTVDNRDAMHRRGWTYFKVEGQIEGEKASGTGRLPFVYETSQVHTPWLKLSVGSRAKVADDGAEALAYGSSRKTAESRRGGSFFKGLGRPWMGLHTIDTVRRDAAEQGVWFDTKYEPGEEKAEVTLTCKQGRLVYTIDMEKDVVDKILIATSNGKEGELRFSYLQDIDETGDEFVKPQIRRSYAGTPKKSPGILWLLDIAAGGLPAK